MGFSASKSSSSSSSSASSFDNLDASSFNFGESGTTQRGSSGSSQRVAFEDIFAQLFGGASGAAAGVDPSAITESANMLFSSGTGFLNNLDASGVGGRHLEEQLAGSPDIVDQQIELLASDLGEFLSETVNPAITAGGVAAGTLGQSRGEVQRGIAAEGALEEFARGSTAIRAGERDRTTGIAQFLEGNELGRNESALASLPSLFGLAESGALGSLSPFAALSHILGPVTSLTDSTSTQTTDSFGRDVGGSTTTGRAASESESKSKSSSSSFGASFPSDRRLKRNIRRIGTVKGYPWYSFNFVTGETSAGVMSDEIPAEFVATMANGYDAVDYAALLA